MSEIKTIDDLRRKVSAIVGVAIPPHSFEAIILGNEVARMGKFAEKQINHTIIAMLHFMEYQAEEIEKQAQKIDTLANSIEEAEKKPVVNVTLPQSAPVIEQAPKVDETVPQGQNIQPNA